MALAAATSWRSPPSATTKRRQREGTLTEVLRVLRRDHQFIGDRVGPLRDRLSKAFEDLIWLRGLEDPGSFHVSIPPSWPKLSYAPGLSGVGLLKADIEALGVYFRHLQHVFKVLSMPLPEVYDPQNVSEYFSCRPHVLAFRVLEVLSSIGLAAIKLHSSRSFNFTKNGMQKDGSVDTSKYYIGQLLKESILNLGPTFIKVGQSLSTRPDIIGSEISEALSELHDNVPPFPRKVAMKIIEEEMGCPVSNIFSYISEKPVAAASFGQVYQGRTAADGSVVAVKVQRPNLLHVVLRDAYILRLGLAIVRKVAKRKSDLCLYADELGKGLVGELDYTLEAENASRFRDAHSRYSFMSVPKVFSHLTKKRVLTMEWVIGENPNDLLLLSRGSLHHDNGNLKKQEVEAKSHLLDLVSKGVEASLVQLLETGLLHADPHPGNLRYTPDGCVSFLDFGLLCRMEKKHQRALLACIVHIVNGDWGALVCDLVEMEVVQPGTSLRWVAMDLEEALGEVVFQGGIPDIKFSKVLGRIWSIALKHHFRMPPYYTLVLRSLASLEGLALAADPNFKTFHAAYPYVVEKLLYDNSPNMRRILYSVVFNRRREFQWDKILLFLRIGVARKGKNRFGELGPEKILKDQIDVRESVIETANLIMKLVTSKDGAVLRRLLMTADPTSLARLMVSKDAVFFRQHVCEALANVISAWMIDVIRAKSKSSTMESHLLNATKVHLEMEAGLPAAASRSTMWLVLTDRRLRVIFLKVLDNISSDPVLMLRFCWSSLTICIRALVLALRQSLVYWSEAYLTSLSFWPTQFPMRI